MEYSVDKLDEAIYFFLTTHPDIPYSVSSIYKNIIDENICKELKDDNYQTHFRTICMMLNRMFKHVHKFYIDDTIYLIYSTDDDVTVLNKHKYSNSLLAESNIDIDNMFDTHDYCNMLQYMIKNPLLKSKYNIDEFVNDNDAAIHVATKENNDELVQAICTNFNVNISRKNKEGKTPIDIAMENNNTKIMKSLLTFSMESEIGKQQEMIHRLQADNNLLKQKLNNKNRFYNFFLQIMLGIVIVQIAVIVYPIVYPIIKNKIEI